MSEAIVSIHLASDSKPLVAIPPLSIRKIVLGYENDACGHRALRWAEEIADFFGAELIATQSVTLPPPSVDIDFQALKEEILQCANAQLASDLRTHLNNATRCVPGFVTFDSPAKLLLHTAYRLNADLVIVGAHCRPGIDQFLFGSVSESVAYQCTCPVLVCGAGCDFPAIRGKTVLFASSASDLQIRAAEYARAVAERTGATLVALQTLTKRPPADLHDRQWKEDHARGLMRIALGEPPDDGENVRYFVRYGNVAEEVLALAEREKASLIVLGSGDRVPGADHVSWHPIANILRSAECPVLIISDVSK